MTKEQDKEALDELLAAINTMNAALDKASAIGIKVNFINVSSFGKLNDYFLLGEAVRDIRERILP